MKTTNLFTKTIFQVAMLAVMAGLAGCGSDDDKPDTQLCLLLFIIPVQCSTGSTAPAQQPIMTQSTTAQAGNDNGAYSAIDSRPVVTNQVDEFEQNNTLDNANIVQFLSASHDNAVAIEISGSVEQPTDAADFFIFTPERSAQYDLYLCGESCDEAVEDDAVYIMIYDQFQTTIDGTPVGTLAEQTVTAELSAGLAYYVEVHGYNTGPIDYSYQLVIKD
jgi:hypothetical protein